MLLPIRSKNPPESFPFATIGLIILNTVIYAATSNGFQVRESAVKQFAVTGRTFDLPHILSSMFLHAEPTHLIGNMFFLYLLGFAVEGRMRSLKFLALYFVSGAAGDLLHHLLFAHSHPDIPSLGASGAIMGVLGAALYMFPFAKVTFFYGFSYWWWGTFDWAIYGVGILYLGFDILIALTGFADGVGHLAHIGGAAAGFLIAAALRIKRDTYQASEAKAVLADTKDFQTLSRLELEDLHRINPDDTALVVNWVYRSMREPGGPRPNCVNAFVRLLPKIVREEEPGPVAQCVLTLNLAPGSIPVAYLAQLATKLERSGDNLTSLRLYEMILADPSTGGQDLESALFRAGMLCESAMGNYARAQTCYREIISRFPMGTFAEQARLRLAYVSTRLGPGPN